MEEMSCNEYTNRGCTNFDENAGTICRTGGCNKLNVYDWLQDIPQGTNKTDLVEIRFKNTRKGFYININELNLKQGDVVAVEASPGHDIGVVSLTGELVYEQVKKNSPDLLRKGEFKKVYRKVRPLDLEKWKSAIDLEHSIMLRAREMAHHLRLNMKIGDVEFQGDKTKAIFYYIADERVDFRELIKLLAEEFKIRVEMRQIGARQEAGRIGGIGACGRELCCATWVTNFNSVTTNSARHQELSLNPQKLAGQCGKLKCCLNYELDVYIDAQKDLPSKNIPLETVDGKAYHVKTDIFKKIMWYTHGSSESSSIVPIPVDRVKEIIRLNRVGKKVEILVEEQAISGNTIPDTGYQNAVGQESLTRFDNKNKKKKKRKKRPQKPRRRDNNQQKTNDAKK